MALKKNDLKKLNGTQLKEKLVELKKELIKINAQVATGTNPQNPGQVKQIKKNIARIKTFLNQLSNKEVSQKK